MEELSQKTWNLPTRRPGIKIEHLRMYENTENNSKASLGTLERLALALEIPISELIQTIRTQ